MGGLGSFLQHAIQKESHRIQDELENSHSESDDINEIKQNFSQGLMKKQTIDNQSKIRTLNKQISAIRKMKEIDFERSLFSREALKDREECMDSSKAFRS